MADKPVLILTGSQIHDMLWEPLEEHYRMAFCEANVAALARSTGISCASIQEAVTQDIMENMKAKSMKIVKRIMDRLEDETLFLSKEHKHLHGEIFGTWFPPYVYERMTQIMAYIAGIYNVQKEHGISGILLHEDVTGLGKGVAQFGNAEDIPTLHLAHANHFIPSGTTDLHCRTTAKYIGAAGTYMKNWYMDCGVSEENITLVGVPQWDKHYDEDLLPTRQQARAAFGLKEDDLVITFASTWPQMVSVGGRAWANSIEVLDKQWERMADAVKNMNAKIIVKMHPSGGPGREEIYQKTMEEKDLKGVIVRAYNTHTIRAADCVVSQSSSNFAIESLILGTPAIELFAPGSKIKDIPGTWGEDLEDMITKAIDDGTDRSVVEQYNYLDDGNAADRTLEWIRAYAK